MRSFLSALFYCTLVTIAAAQSSIGQLQIVTKYPQEQLQFLGASSALMLIDTLDTNHYIYTLDLGFWTHHLPEQAHIRPSKLSIQALPNKQFSIIQDLDGDGLFDDEVVQTLTLGDALSIQYPIFYGEHQSLVYSFSLEIFNYYQSFHPSLTPLFKYQIKQCVIPEIDSIFYHPSTLLPAIYVHSKDFPQLSNTYHLIGEPFRIGKTWYTVETPDLWKGTVRIRQLHPEEKPLGYRPGYYTNIERLTQQVNMALGTTVMTTQAEERGYTLHHFWGPWCHPCMAETAAVQLLENRLQHNNIQVVHHCYIFNRHSGDAQKWLKVLEELIQTDKVHPRQVVTILPDSNATTCYKQSINPFKDGCNPIHLLNINRFPSYVLIAPDGRILYHNDSRVLRGDPKFERLLEKISTKQSTTTVMPKPKSPRG